MKWMKKVLFLWIFVAYPVAAAPTPGTCEMRVTGDMHLNFQVPQTILGVSTPGDTAALTDYWRTNEELRSQYVTQSRYLRINESDVDIKRGADVMLAGHPKA